MRKARKISDSKLGFEVGSGLKKSQSRYSYEGICRLYGAEVKKLKLGIIGSRRRNSLQDKAILKERILSLKPDSIISGGCPKGADKFAEELAKELSIPIKIFYPQIPKSGGPRWVFVKAYHARNELVAKNSDHLIALVASDRKGGTENTIGHFKRFHNEKNLEIL